MSRTVNLDVLKNDEKALHLSDKYNVIKSSDIVEKFEKKGFVITDYSEARVRSQDKENKQKHFVRMSLADSIKMPERPEVILHNSYDGSTALKMYIGMYRFACDNGMVIGDHLSEPLKMKHTNKQWDYLIYKFIEEYDAKINSQQRVVNQMKNIPLDKNKEYEFACRAIELREDINDVVDPMELVQVRRIEDNAMNLWNTFNKVQESIIGGLFQKKFDLEADGETTHIIKKASKLTDVNRIMKVNHDLSGLAKDFIQEIYW